MMAGPLVLSGPKSGLPVLKKGTYSKYNSPDAQKMMAFLILHASGLPWPSCCRRHTGSSHSRIERRRLPPGLVLDCRLDCRASGRNVVDDPICPPRVVLVLGTSLDVPLVHGFNVYMHVRVTILSPLEPVPSLRVR
jgi:hypothetical protein